MLVNVTARRIRDDTHLFTHQHRAATLAEAIALVTRWILAEGVDELGPLMVSAEWSCHPFPVRAARWEA